MTGIVAVVAGASGDIGRAISQDLARAGIDLLLVGRNHERLTAVAAGLDAPERAKVVVADLAQANGIESVYNEVVRAGGVDCLVLGSGIYERSGDPAVFAHQFANNVLGPYALIRRLLPFLIAARGQIVFLNSTQGLLATKGVDQFAATQHAMKAVADSLRDEINPLGVRVVSLFLGRTATERQKAIFAAEQRVYSPNELIQPRDVASLVVCLLNVSRTTEVTDVKLRPMQK